MPTIILCGRRRVGKDTCADFIEKYFEESKYHVNRLALAKPLKIMCADSLNISVEKLENMKENNEIICGGTARDFLINFSKNILYICGQDYWIKSTYNKIDSDPKCINIITDMRYIREYLFFKKIPEEIIMIKIVKHLDDKLQDEIDIDSFESNYTIDNEFSLESFGKSIEIILNSCFHI